MGRKAKPPTITKKDSTSSKSFKLAGWLRHKYRFHVMMKKGNVPIWIYDDEKGIWIPDGEPVIRKDVEFLLQGLYTRHISRETEGHIRDSSYKKGVELGTLAEKIVLQNGTYDLENFKFDAEFYPDEYHITGVPVKYDPQAKCPEIRKFLSEILPNSEDRIAVIEFLGYCLWKNYAYAIILMLLGEGDNGKSTLVSLLKEFLGKENLAACTPQQLAENRFSKAQLHGRLANIGGDIPSKPLKYTGELKMMTGGDLIQAEHKNQQQFGFYNYAKLIFSANILPMVPYDDTDAFHKRMRIIDFPIQFRAGEPGTIPRHILLKRLTTPEELSGLLNLAIKGLKRLHRTGKLTGSHSIEESRLRFYKRSDPIQYMVKAFCYPNPLGEPIYKDHLHDLYTQLCMRLKKEPKNDEWFAKDLKRAAPYITEIRPYVESEDDKGNTKKDRIRMWSGLGIDFDALNSEIAGEIGPPCPTKKYSTEKNELCPPCPAKISTAETYDEIIIEGSSQNRVDRLDTDEKSAPGNEKSLDDIFNGVFTEEGAEQ